MKNYFTGRHELIQLSQQLGRGGEGAVFDISGHANFVAKLYHQPPNAKKQAKLGFMAANATASLFEYCAWPKDTLHLTKGGPVVGFFMPKVNAKVPIHTLYGPAQRKQDFPKAAWDFLLYTARNTAAAFETLHKHHHVLGDVNQGNVMVGHDSKVMLIDCDSYQVNEKGTLHLCEVGVSHFTPPELQGSTLFDRTQRTTNHDNFGLALLVFHLLFGGRHPYAGRPLRNGVGDSLEEDIKAFRYAYAPDAKNRGTSPPPNAIPLSLVSAEVQQMFVTAFTEPGAKGQRPGAEQWLKVLDDARARLKRCAQSKMHVFPTSLSSCPWCALDEAGIVHFIDLGGAFTAPASNFSLARTWAAIESVNLILQQSIPKAADFSVIAVPLPDHLVASVSKYWWKFAVILIGVGIFLAWPKAWLPIAVLTWIAWVVVGVEDKGPLQAEKRRRDDARNTAKSAYDAMFSRVQGDAHRTAFANKKKELADIKREYEGLDAREKSEIEKLDATAEKRQKKQYLERHFIEKATIHGVGGAKKAALRSFGIETAADVSYSRVSMVKGFGDVLTRSVVDWKNQVEKGFHFDPRRAVTDADKAKVRSTIYVRRRALEAALSAAPEALQALRLQVQSAYTQNLDELRRAAQRLAQADADKGITN